MSDTISQRELRNESGRVMRSLSEGRTYIVTRNSEPIGELRPYRRRRFVDVDSVRRVFEGASAIDREQFRSDVDAAADHDIEPRG